MLLLLLLLLLLLPAVDVGFLRSFLAWVTMLARRDPPARFDIVVDVVRCYFMCYDVRRCRW